MVKITKDKTNYLIRCRKKTYILTGHYAEIYKLLKNSPEMAVASISKHIKLSGPLVKHLFDVGILIRSEIPSGGRGRPAYIYSVSRESLEIGKDVRLPKEFKVGGNLSGFVHCYLHKDQLILLYGVKAALLDYLINNPGWYSYLELSKRLRSHVKESFDSRDWLGSVSNNVFSLKEMGFVVEDTANGPKLKKI